MSRDRATWAWFFVVMVLAAGLVLPDLDAGQWRTWDEGLYARLARNALEHDRYLYAVDESGAFMGRFSKPPMSLWLTAASFSVFGLDLFALRLPFALGMLALVGFAFAWGNRLAGLPMAVAWSGGLALCAATTRWGRHACIEPLFLSGMIGGLWAYHGSMVAQDARTTRRWAAAAGLGFAFAMLTKQLAVGLGLAPIVVLELWRRDRACLTRVALALGVPAVVGAAWFLWAGAATDGAVFDALVDRGVRRRMEGFGGGQNARTLNELSHVVAEACAPIPWPLGAVGLAVLTVFRPRAELRRPGPDTLLPLWFAASVLILENVSQSMLPWYALHVTVPAIGGAAWLVAATARASGRTPLRLGRSALGWATLGATAIAAADGVVSQLDVAVLGGLFLLAGVIWKASTVRYTALAAVALLMLGSRLRDPELHPPAQPFAPFMKVLADTPRVAVDRRSGLPALGMRGLFGAQAKEVAGPPWPTDAYDAYVSTNLVPSEYEPPPGVALHRSAGATAFVGDLSARAWSSSHLEALLDRGPITFEAEHLGAAVWNTDVADADASGGRLRRYSLYRNEQADKIALSIGPKIRLPEGHYVLELWMRWSCDSADAQRSAAVILASTDKGKLIQESLACADAPSAIQPQRFEFDLRRPETFNMRVGYRYGTVDHDRTVLQRVR